MMLALSRTCSSSLLVAHDDCSGLILISIRPSTRSSFFAFLGAETLYVDKCSIMLVTADHIPTSLIFISFWPRSRSSILHAFALHCFRNNLFFVMPPAVSEDCSDLILVSRRSSARSPIRTFLAPESSDIDLSCVMPRCLSKLLGSSP